MDKQRTASLADNVDREFLDDSSQTFPLTVLLAFLVVFATIVILWWAKNRQRAAYRGECLLLCGISNAGKTLMFTRLTIGMAKRTITSMATNRGSLLLANLSSDRPSKTVRILDIPGNLRIRQREFEANKASAKAIVFVVDSTTINDESKDVADYLYDVLREKVFRQQRLPLLIVCNKQDLNNGNETSASIRRLLEKELTMKRRTRVSSVAVHQGKSDNSEDIGQEGKDAFDFDDVKDMQVEFVDASALGIERQAFARQYDDNEDDDEDDDNDNDNSGVNVDSAGDETDVDGGVDLVKVTDWIERIWMK